MVSLNKEYFLTKYPKADAKDLLLEVLELLKPPPNYTVSEYITEFMKMRDQNGYYRSYNAKKTFYMVDPLNDLSSRNITEVIFMGPARTGKSESLLKGFATYCIGYSKQNLLIIHMTQDKAAEWSKNEFQVMINSSPELEKQKTKNANDINVHEARFKSNCLIFSKWPSITNLSAVTIQNVIFTDYDRIPENVDGEGNPYYLGKRRTTTYGNRAKCVVESSPGFPVVDPKQQLLPHECYKSKGIATLYNQGDQHCFYYQCLAPECREFFWAEPSVIWWDDSLDTIAEKAKTARVKCPVCGHLHTDRENKLKLIPNGRWVAKGQRLDKYGVLHGNKAVHNKTRSYWLRAPACAFISLEDIVMQYLNALKAYNETGSESELQSFYNTTFGEPYVPRRYIEGNVKESDFTENIDRTVKVGECPSDTLVVLASVDIQNGKKSRFEFSIFAYTVRHQAYLVYRGEINKFRQIPVQPDLFKDHFMALEEILMKIKIKVQDHEDTYLKIHGIILDEGGECGTTQNAKEYWLDFHKRYQHKNPDYSTKDRLTKMMLAKGVSHRWLKKLLYVTPNIRKKGYSVRTDAAHVLQCRVRDYKDQLFNRCRAPLQQSNSFHLNEGLSNKVFNELPAEERTNKGYYQLKPNFKRNETIDLCVYFFAMVDHLQIAEHIVNIKSNNLLNVPKYLLPIDNGNENVIRGESAKEYMTIEDFETNQHDVIATLDETIAKNEELLQEVEQENQAITKNRSRQRSNTNSNSLNFGINKTANRSKANVRPNRLRF